MSIGEHVVYVTPAEGGANVNVSCLIDEVTIQHGRADAGGQPEASTATIAIDVGDETLPPAVDIGAAVEVRTVIGEVAIIRFVGRLTDITLGWDDAGEATPNSGVGQLIATSKMADLGRRVVGDAPFPQELDGARVARVLNLAGYPTDPLTSDPGTVQVLARDIDARAALEVAQDTATSAGGIVWETRDSDVRYADASHRRGIASSLSLDACDVLVTPTWARTMQGLINKVTIAYGVAPEGGEQPTTSGNNAVSMARYGTYDYSFTSELAALADAQAMASLLLARNSTPVWVMTDLPVDLKGLSDSDTLDVLRLDMHSLIDIEGLPALGGAPTTAHLWVEGWQERLAWDVHEIELHVSGYCRTAPAPRWDDVATAWTWDGMSITWDEAVCFGPPLPGDRWADVPASTRWDTLSVSVTWDTYTGGTL